MEFHADAVAATAAGANQLVNSLVKMDLASATYEGTLNYCTDLLTDNRRLDNLYPAHIHFMNQVASSHDIPIEHGLPVFKNQEEFFVDKSKIVIKDQWASHPATHERIEKLKSYGLNTENAQTSTWSLFNDAKEVQIKMTEKVYEADVTQVKREMVGVHEFKQLIHDSTKYDKVPKAFKGYFDNHIPSIIEPEDDKAATEQSRLKDLITDKMVNLCKTLAALEADLNTLEWLKSPESNVKTFEFQGVKRRPKEIDNIIKGVNEKLEAMRKTLADHDLKMYQSCILSAEKTSSQDAFRAQYQDMLNTTDRLFEVQTNIDKINQSLAPLYQGQEVLIVDAEKFAMDAAIHEKPIKEDLKSLLLSDSCSKYWTEGEINHLKQYVDEDDRYFLTNSWNEPAIERMNKALGLYNFYYLQTVKQKKQALLLRIEQLLSD